MALAATSTTTMMSASDSEDDNPPVLVGSKVPLTLLTGYLGAGKSTLIQHILSADHGLRIAVIMNEFSDTADIESRSISIQSATGATSSPLLTLPNGCLCCAARDDGFAAIQEMVAQRGSFDYILLETTGLADPGPIAESFWRNEEWDADVRLDGVVCVVDAMWGLKQQLEKPEVEGEATEWEKQIACADVILLNKVADVPLSQVEEVEEAIRRINLTAQIHRTTRSILPLSNILDLKAYSPNPNEQPVVPSFLSSRSDPTSESRAHAHPHPSAHTHSSQIASTVIPLPALSIEQIDSVKRWIQSLLWDPESLQQSESSPPEVLRLKGIFWTDAEREPQGWVLQGVRGVYELEEITTGERGKGEGKIVVIGRYVDLLGDSLKEVLWKEDS
ncbi:Cobalamin synthesis protein [Phaffia rhodozyma]|uniref:Cobalamin synthesis protein n=1 Tax=Phaffia rhodozyma TaxID=264483 RepID=A0A0F7SR57_PHARH|nr:Cobalamin synthesis protein [Phaffia rhodozyma]